MSTSVCTPGQLADPDPIEGTWLVDTKRSHARFVAATLRGAVKVPGAFGSLAGTLVAGADGASGTLTIDAAGVDTGSRLRDHHLRSRDFFAVAQHPELRYELRSMTPGSGELVALNGDLVVAGRRTSLPLEATLRPLSDAGAEIACKTRVDRVALGVRGARAMVPRTVELDILVRLRRSP
jgi:polyisoprenoid-binding protein YceI